MEARDSEILKLLQNNNRISVAELVARFGVSEVTARKDLARLEKSGRAVRTRGGAILARIVAVAKPIDAVRHECMEAKAAIAQEAAAMIKNGDTVFVDSGTTMTTLAGLLQGRPIRLATHSLPVIELLQDDDALSIYVLGGIFNKEARSFIGPSAAADLERYSFDLAFVGTSGVALNGVLGTQNFLEADIKRKALAAARVRVVLADSSKINAASFAVFARAGDYDCIICDNGIDEDAARKLRATGTRLVIVETPSGIVNRSDL